jgi:hypothetical protein
MGMNIAEEEEKNLTQSSQRAQRRAQGVKCGGYEYAI